MVDLVKLGPQNLRRNQPTYFENSLEQRDGEYSEQAHL